MRDESSSLSFRAVNIKCDVRSFVFVFLLAGGRHRHCQCSELMLVGSGTRMETALTSYNHLPHFTLLATIQQYDTASWASFYEYRSTVSTRSLHLIQPCPSYLRVFNVLLFLLSSCSWDRMLAISVSKEDMPAVNMLPLSRYYRRSVLWSGWIS